MIPRYIVHYATAAVLLVLIAVLWLTELRRRPVVTAPANATPTNYDVDWSAISVPNTPLTIGPTQATTGNQRTRRDAKGNIVLVEPPAPSVTFQNSSPTYGAWSPNVRAAREVTTYRQSATTIQTDDLFVNRKETAMPNHRMLTLQLSGRTQLTVSGNGRTVNIYDPDLEVCTFAVDGKAPFCAQMWYVRRALIRGAR